MFEHEFAVAHELADLAADVALGYFRVDGLDVKRKADSSLVTAADMAVERTIREHLAATFPDDRIIGEEEGGSHDRAARVWIVDPIDSTANFARGIQIWATLVALRVDGEGVIGIVSAPALEERYAGVKGQGATLNGTPIHVSDIDELKGSHLLFQELNRTFSGPYRNVAAALIQECWRPRGFGDFWAHMLVARGSAEAMLEPQLAIWDLAAPEVVIREAGGRCTTFEGGPLVHDGSMLVTNGLIHDELLARLAEGRAD